LTHPKKLVFARTVAEVGVRTERTLHLQQQHLRHTVRLKSLKPQAFDYIVRLLWGRNASILGAYGALWDMCARAVDFVTIE